MFGPLLSKPGASEANKTGSWRSNRKPSFLHKECIDCGLCESICPEACIEKAGTKNYNSDLAYCKGCGLCAYVCPKKDIEMVEE
ncbi:MAG: 4Fe-4S dicluster-binding protein [Chlamydiota bacterium]